MGGKHVEYPYILISQGITFLYFFLFLSIIPFTTILENTLIDINNIKFYNISKKVKQDQNYNKIMLNNKNKTNLYSFKENKRYMSTKVVLNSKKEFNLSEYESHESKYVMYLKR